MRVNNEKWAEQAEADCTEIAAQLRAVPECVFGDISVRVMRTIVRRRLVLRASAVSLLAAAALVVWIVVPSRVLPEVEQAPVQALACGELSSTGIAMMALVTGEAHDADVAHAVWALRAEQSPDGRLGGTDDRSMLDHAIATVALLAAYETGRFPESFTVADGAINYIRMKQDASGGWGGGCAAELWLVDALDRASVLGWPDHGASLPDVLRR